MSRASTLVVSSSSAFWRLSAANGGRPEGLRLRLGLADQPLQGPLAALADVGRDPGQGHDRAELGPAAGVGERGQVVLDPVVVAGQGGGAGQLHRAPRPDQAPAGQGRLGPQQDHARHRRQQQAPTPRPRHLPPRPGPVPMWPWTGRAAERFPAGGGDDSPPKTCRCYKFPRQWPIRTSSVHGADTPERGGCGMRTNGRQSTRRWRRGTAGALRSEALVEEAARPGLRAGPQRADHRRQPRPRAAARGGGRRAGRPDPAVAGLPARRGAGPRGRAAGAVRGAGPLPGRGPLGAGLLPRAGLGQLGPVAGPRPARPPRAGHRHGPRPDRHEALRARAPLLRVHVQADRRGRLQPPGPDRRRPDHLPLHPLRHGPGVAAGRRRARLQPDLVLLRLRVREAARGQRAGQLRARPGPARAGLGQGPAAAAGRHPRHGPLRPGRGRPAGRGPRGHGRARDRRRGGGGGAGAVRHPRAGRRAGPPGADRPGRRGARPPGRAAPGQRGPGRLPGAVPGGHRGGGGRDRLRRQLGAAADLEQRGRADVRLDGRGDRRAGR